MLFSPKNWLLSVAFILPAFLHASVALPDTAYFSLRDTFCNSQIILIGNQFFGPDTPSGQVVFPGAASDGSDSIVTVQLTFLQRPEITISQNLCIGDTLYINGTAYHNNFFLGEEIVVGGAANGCDSLIHVDLHFAPAYTLLQRTICEGDTLFVNNTVYDAFRPIGTEVIPNGGSTGCDSIIEVDLTVLTPPFSEIKDTLCPDEFRLVNDRRYDVNNRAGLEIIKGAASTGCDSLVTVALIFREIYVQAGDDQTVAKGDSVCIEPIFGFTPVEIIWSPAPPCDMPDCERFCYQPSNSVLYQLKAIDQYGCISTDDIRINVTNENLLYAPTVFSPDAGWPDNRFFLSAGRGTTRILRMCIADRWGEIMFEKSNFLPDDPDQGWDGMFRGTFAPVATYIYIAELEKIDGTTYLSSGSVTLVR